MEMYYSSLVIGNKTFDTTSLFPLLLSRCEVNKLLDHIKTTRELKEKRSKVSKKENNNLADSDQEEIDT